MIEEILFVCAMCSLLIAVWFLIFAGLLLSAHATVIEDRASWCMKYEFPYTHLCFAFEMDRQLEELHKNFTREWNKTH